jgi:ABC-type sugar transport system ATPase subunit
MRSQKVYEVVFGEKERDGDRLHVTGRTVVAKDAEEAIKKSQASVAEEWKGEENAPHHFIESVRLIAVLDE